MATAPPTTTPQVEVEEEKHRSRTEHSEDDHHDESDQEDDPSKKKPKTKLQQPPRYPVIIVVCGNAGTGKTTYARRIAAKYGAIIIDIDETTGPVVQAGLKAAGMDENDRDSIKYKSIFREPIHEALFSVCREQLRANNGLPCVIVAPFTQERDSFHFTMWIRDQLGVSLSPPPKWSGSKIKKPSTHLEFDPTITSPPVPLTPSVKAGEDLERLTVHVYPVVVVCNAAVREQRIRQRANPRDKKKFLADGTIDKRYVQYSGETPTSKTHVEQQASAKSATAETPTAPFKVLDVSQLPPPPPSSVSEALSMKIAAPTPAPLSASGARPRNPTPPSDTQPYTLVDTTHDVKPSIDGPWSAHLIPRSKL